MSLEWKGGQEDRREGTQKRPWHVTSGRERGRQRRQLSEHSLQRQRRVDFTPPARLQTQNPSTPTVVSD